MNRLYKKGLGKFSIIKKNDLFGKSIYNLFIQVIGLGLSYLGVYLITHTYDAEVLGYFTLASIVLQISTIIVLLGVNTAAVQMIPGLRLKNDVASINSIFIKAVLQILIIGVLATLVLYFSAGYIANTIMHKPKLTVAYQITSFAIIPSGLFTFLADFLRGHGKNTIWAVVNRILVFFVFIIIFLIVLYTIKNPDPIGINVIANFVTFIVTVIMLLYVYKKEHITISLKNINHSPTYAQIRKLSFPMFLFSSTLLLSSWITTIMVGTLGTTTDTGIYRVVDRVSSLNILILTAVNAILAPKIAASFSSNNIPAMRQNVIFAAKLIFWLSLPIQIGLLVFHDFALGIFGKEFLKGDLALIIVLVGQTINALTGPCSLVLNMTHYQVFLRNVSLAGLLLTVVLNYILIPIYGINGAAFASMFNVIFVNILCVKKVRKELSFSTFYNPLKSLKLLNR